MKRQPVLVLDIGSRGIAWAIGQPRLDQHLSIPGQPPRSPFELLGWGTVDMEGPGPHDPTRLAQAVERALKDVTVAPMPDRASACLSHPTLSHHTVTTQVDLADEPIMVRRADLERLRSLAITQAMPIDHEVLYLEPLGYAGNGFSGVADPRGLTATRLRGTFHLVTIPRAIRLALLQALEFLGIEVEGLTYRPQALVASGVCGEPRTTARANDSRSSLPSQAGLPVVRGEGRRVLHNTSADARRGCVAGERILLVDGDGLVCDIALVDQGRLVKAQTLKWEPGDTKQVLKNWFVSPNCQEPPPSRAIVTGRIGLVDGIVEQIEQAAGVSAVLGRSPWAQPLGELSRQVAASPVLGMLAMATEQPTPTPFPLASSRLIDRLLTRTKHILVEYF